jgi:NADPH:quinone reductase-like Zn-dependent oxidoreductase
MKAAILHAADSVPVYGDFDDPVPGERSEIVDLVATGIHQLTRSVATGRHYSRGGAFPVIPGLNAVARTARGELVFTSSGPPPYGTFAERIASPAAMRFPLPPAASPGAEPGTQAGAQPEAVAEAVAAGVNPGMASWLPLKARQAEVARPGTELKAGQAEAGSLGTVLVLGVTGVSGFLAAQNARLLGASRVVGAGRSQPGLERAAAAGADTVALTGDRDADAEALAKSLDGDTPGLVLDFLWGSVAETAFAALVPGTPVSPGTAPPALSEDGADTRYVQIGALAGAEAAVPSALLRSRKITISGSGAGSVAAADIKGQIPVYIKLIAEGGVQVPFRTFLLSDVGAAWTASAQAGPRVVLVPG